MERFDRSLLHFCEIFGLGERYYELFSSQQDEFGRIGKGIVREDGYGEITIRELEDALHMELSEINSLNPTGLNRLALHTLQEVIKPEQVGEHYKVMARDESVTPPQEVIIDDVDVLVAAGGANSPTMKSHLQSEVVTETKLYGIACWQNPKLKNQALDSFDDFRQTVVINQDFVDAFRSQLEKSFSEGELSWLEPDQDGSSVQDSLSEIVRPDSRVMDDFSNAVKGTSLQVRCFENKGLVYIGMEIPTELLGSVVGRINRVKFPTREARAHVRKMVEQAWFNTVAKTYKLDEKIGLSPSDIDQKFTTTFLLNQSQLKETVKVESSQGAELIVTAAGDAAVSPHFMGYSGLTGAREHILQLGILAEKLSRQPDKEETLAAIRTLEEKAQRVADFVISRGLAFLDFK